MDFIAPEVPPNQYPQSTTNANSKQLSENTVQTFNTLQKQDKKAAVKVKPVVNKVMPSKVTAKDPNKTSQTQLEQPKRKSSGSRPAQPKVEQKQPSVKQSQNTSVTN